MELPPCRKKSKMSYLELTKLKITKPESLQSTKHLDFMRIISFNPWKILQCEHVGILNGLLKNAPDDM